MDLNSSFLCLKFYFWGFDVTLPWNRTWIWFLKAIQITETVMYNVIHCVPCSQVTVFLFAITILTLQFYVLLSKFSLQPPLHLAAQHTHILPVGVGLGARCHSCYVLKCSLPHCFAPLINGSHLLHLFEKSKLSVQWGELGFGQTEFNFKPALYRLKVILPVIRSP